VIVIDNGKILESPSLAELRDQLQRTRQAHVEVEGPAAQVEEALQQLSGVEAVRRANTGGQNSTVAFVVEYHGDDIRKFVSKTITDKGWGLLEVRSLEPTLEDMYLQLIRNEEGRIESLRH
jgi:ABC-2 type transport system ATP-binding protein